jgi:hypothetical protein
MDFLEQLSAPPQLQAFITSLAIGLLIGLERERRQFGQGRSAHLRPGGAARHFVRLCWPSRPTPAGSSPPACWRSAP